MSLAAGATQAKRKMTKRIGTHSGTFHCDEALGCFLLRQTDKFADAEVVRTRDPEVLKDLDAVIDVGGVYNPEANRFDHHQRGFEEVFGHGHSMKLSSAGLVYKHYGREVVARVAGLDPGSGDLEAVYLAVYRSFMEAIDAIDNGINQWDSAAPPRYTNSTHLSARVGQLNPAWNEEGGDEVLLSRFAAAAELAGAEFVESVRYHAQSWLPARSIVKDSLDQRTEADPSGGIMRLLGYCPWKEHLYVLEREAGIEGQVIYVVYEDEREKKWRVQAVGAAPGSFESRKALPVPWRGLRDAELSAAACLPGCVFVHASGFIGGHETLEGALEMARRALAFAE